MSREGETAKIRCECCGKYFFPREHSDNGEFISRHHLVFPKRVFAYIQLLNPDYADIVAHYRNPFIFGADLCARNGNGGRSEAEMGCHEKLSIQTDNRCCGIDNNVEIVGSNLQVLVGMCPLISLKSPIDPSMEGELPNEFCEFCFYFQAIFSPDKYAPLMDLISESPHYAGEIAKRSLRRARSDLLRKGFSAIRIERWNKINRWKPTYKGLILDTAALVQT